MTSATRFEEVLTSLWVIAKLTENKRLSTRKGYVDIERDNKTQFLYRWWYDDDRWRSLDEAKKIIGNLEDRFVISTVGLVRPKRGMEKVIHALPDVVKKHPHMLYHIAGKTHPKKLINGNDPYRKMLQEETRRLGLEDNIRFTNHYLPLNSLLRNIRASDLGITPYSNVGQISSGVLSYYLGLGVPVISTPFLYAQEVLADGRGIILPELDNSDAITDTLLDVLDNPKKLEQMKANMAPFTEQMRWPNVAKQYVKEERKLIKT